MSQFFNCPFAVKSGGHAAFAGASNIEGGVTIDLARLKQIQVSSDRTLTRVGAGNRWVDVYSHLDPMQLSVVGGRVADIGVGGLTLGGGISFFSGRYGWALDSVINYEVCRILFSLKVKPQLIIAKGRPCQWPGHRGESTILPGSLLCSPWGR